MTTRRKASNTADAITEKDQDDFTVGPSEKSDISPAVPAHVIFKLLGFTLAMVVGPIGTYFLTLNLVFKGNSTFAGATAAIMANVVLVAYIIVAFQEDQSANQESSGEKESKKSM